MIKASVQGANPSNRRQALRLASNAWLAGRSFAEETAINESGWGVLDLPFALRNWLSVATKTTIDGPAKISCPYEVSHHRCDPVFITRRFARI
ncbi:hypothetical protein Poly41_66730 [Novipirellula artificiosorum]|uniref:Uncharacterized protein n=1 Tax=Novipirellula artificiosorum TaxID=2528016 RepID=A0A5C6D1H5_9BACT|nr:hypothetical protein Poly41_66730 [Novipirellula artificiosorum]